MQSIATRLGSAQLVTDYEGEEYEHIEYTPYGEMWIERTRDNAVELPFRFTGKEFDSETNLYYYGARYMDPRTSRWISSDPAGAMLANPMGSDGKPRQNFSIIESLNHYSYVANNPVKYNDPTGKALNFAIGAVAGFITSSASEIASNWQTSGNGFISDLGSATARTFSSGKSLAVIGASTAIGAATSGGSAIASSAATSGATSVVAKAATNVAINAAASGIGAMATDVSVKAIRGEVQDLSDTLTKGATSAAIGGVISIAAQSTIAANSGRVIDSTTDMTGLTYRSGRNPDIKITGPGWEQSAGTYAENIAPAAIDIWRNMGEIGGE